MGNLEYSQLVISSSRNVGIVSIFAASVKVLPDILLLDEERCKH